MTTQPCRLCTQRGQTHDYANNRCQSHSSQHSRQCEAMPMAPLRVCSAHGGLTPVAVASRANRKAAARLKAEAARHVVYGRLVDVSPTEALLEEVKWTAGHVAWLRGQVQAMEAAALMWGKAEEVTKHATEFEGTDTTFKAGVTVLLALYQGERKHLVEVCAAAIRSGVEERLVRLAEAQGDLLGPWLRWLVEAMATRFDVVLDEGNWEAVRLMVVQLLGGLEAGRLPQVELEEGGAA